MNLVEGLRSSARRLPDKPALIFQGRKTSYADLDDRVERVAAGFQRAGFAAGDRVGLMLANSPQFVEAFYGALRAGLVVVPLNVAYTAEEITHILGDAGARGLVVSTVFLGAVAGVTHSVPSIEHVVVAGSSTPQGGTSTWQQFTSGDDEVEPVEVGPGDLALLQYTSGTTGKPKGAMLSHGNLVANQRQMEQTQLKVLEQDIVLCVLPMFHIYALNVGMAFPLCRGATVLLVERFDPLQTLHDVVAHRASVILGAPPMYVAWVNTPGVADMDLRSVRFAISGAAPLPRSVLERAQTELGIAIWEGYGLTETSPVLTTVAMGNQIVPGSVGKPVPEVEIRLVDEQGRPVAKGDPGEVVVRGPNVFSGYWHQPDATAEVLDADGWFHTGDVGYADDGNLYLVDRKQDLIIVSGFNVYPREVEEVLFRHPKVTQAAVVGTPHPYTGEAVKAVVVLADGEEATAEEITDFCRRSLARFKCPEVVEFAQSLPLLPTGKVRRRDLRTGG